VISEPLRNECVGGRGQLRDGHGRDIGDLRISVTDRCNFRCQYCMPAEGLPWLDRAEILSFEEITRLVRLFADMGVGDVRLTGGEPLVRRDFPVLAGMIAAIDGVNDLSRDALDAVLRGLEILAGFPEAHPIKVNAVAIRGFTEEEVLPFARLARETPYEVRFIEFMPLDADHAWDRSKVLTGAEIREAISAVYPLEPEPRAPSSTSQVYRFADSPGRIGFINPVSEPFCSGCNRVRLTADGRLRTCLFSLNETDLREPLRSGASDDEIEAIIRAAVWRKELKHHVGEPGFIQPARSMSAIGG
jgi:cyclic pyranopterin phosphate synthase